MSASVNCPKCGQPLPADAPHGVCPDCLLGLLEDDAVVLPETQDSKTPPFPSASRRFGDYELLEEVARGGMGIVYRARQVSLDRIVAVKMLLAGPMAGKDFVQRFRTEASAAASLQHPNIVAIHEVGFAEGQHFFAMDYVQGHTLTELVAKGPLPARQAATYLKSIAEAIHFAHERNVLHRDLKPSNVLIDSATDQPRVTDFGLAKRLEAETELTLSGQVLGSPNYMSPEQAMAKRGAVGKRSDVYSLGAILYHLLTGRPPFQGETLTDVLHQVVNNDPLAPHLVTPRVPRDLETICLKCLEKEPARRYQTAQELAEELGRFLNDEPILARPSGVFGRTQKWIRRNPVTAALIPTSAALAAAIAVIVWQRASPNDVDPNSVAVVLRASDTNSTSLAKEFSRELNHLLFGVSGLHVVARGDVLKWETGNASAVQIAKGLRAKSVLLGTIAQVENEFCLNVELVDAAGGATWWKSSWTNIETSWSLLQTQIARDVVTKLNVTLTEKERNLLRRPFTTNEAARLEYSFARKAMDTLTESSLLVATRLFEQAILHDQNFAQAHAGLASAHIALAYTFQEPSEHFRKARTSINAALKLDDSLPEAKIANSLLKYYYDWDWKGAEQDVEEALRLDPSLLEADACYLHALDVQGKGDEALAYVLRACDRHPNSPQIQAERACAAYYASRFDQAEAFCRENLKTDSENALIYWSLGRTLAQKPDYTNALAVLQTAKAKPGGEWPGIDGEIGYVLAKLGQTNEVRKVIEQLHTLGNTAFVDPYIYAMIYAASGETEKVFEQLNRACDVKTPWIASFPTDPKFAPLRNEKGYHQILARLRLPPPTFEEIENKETKRGRQP